ncbi:hypothetical protein ACFQ9X_45135 [Catenulispora yoronensis]
MIPKPTRLFGRDAEWHDLAEFAVSPVPGATLGLVYGRRRQGKTIMLELLAREARGSCSRPRSRARRRIWPIWVPPTRSSGGCDSPWCSAIGGRRSTSCCGSVRRRRCRSSSTSSRT